MDLLLFYILAITEVHQYQKTIVSCLRSFIVGFDCSCLSYMQENDHMTQISAYVMQNNAFLMQNNDFMMQNNDVMMQNNALMIQNNGAEQC